MEEIEYTRQTQKLIYWLLDDYACYLQNINPGSKANIFFKFKAKKELQKLYLKYCGINVNKLKPFEMFKEEFYKKATEIISTEISVENKTNLIVNTAYKLVVTEFQKFILVLDGTFSLSLNMLTQKKANSFLDWLFEFCLYNNIPLKNQIMTLYQEQNLEKYVYVMLKEKKCALCGEKAELHHFDNVNRIGGYKFDDGLKTKFLSLCRKHHKEFHDIGIIDFENKYFIQGIKLTKEQVKELKKIYKGHFKAAI